MPNVCANKIKVDLWHGLLQAYGFENKGIRFGDSIPVHSSGILMKLEGLLILN